MPKRIMAVISAEWDGIKLKLDHEFVAMGGTATCNVMFRDVFVPFGPCLINVLPRDRGQPES